MFAMLAVSVLYVKINTFRLLELVKGDYIPLLVVIQLFGSSVILYLLGEILKSYGITGPWILFIATKFCETMMWQAFSPVVVNVGRGPEFEGSALCLLHLWFTWANKTRALEEALFRVNLPNLSTLAASILIFITIIYLQSTYLCNVLTKCRRSIGDSIKNKTVPWTTWNVSD
jgi:preprotein translocase subunit SecY